MTIEDLKGELGDDEEVVDVEQDDDLDDDDTDGDEDLDIVDDQDDEDLEPEIEMATWTDDEGNEWEVPANLTPSLMKNKDYTTKSQQNALERKALEQERENWKIQQTRSEEDQKLDVELFSVEQSLESYKNVDWDQLESTDPDNAQHHFRKFQLLRQKHDDLGRQKQERAIQKSQEAQQSNAKRLEEAGDYASKNIPNWSPELAEKIEKYAIDVVGHDQDSLMSSLSPRYMKLLYDGYTGHQIKQKAANPTPKPKSKVMPFKQVKAKSSNGARIDLQTADMESYAKARQRGVGG